MTDQVFGSEASNASKRLARLTAVQILYQASFEEEKLSDIIARSLEESFTGMNGDEGNEADAAVINDVPDSMLTSQIATGTLANMEILEEMVTGTLGAKFSLARMERLLKMTLCAGAFELYHHADIAAGIIISDYVDVTRSFFNEKEPALVNAVLDTLAKKLRS